MLRNVFANEIKVQTMEHEVMPALPKSAAEQRKQLEARMNNIKKDISRPNRYSRSNRELDSKLESMGGNVHELKQSVKSSIDGSSPRSLESSIREIRNSLARHQKEQAERVKARSSPRKHQPFSRPSNNSSVSHQQRQQHDFDGNEMSDIISEISGLEAAYSVNNNIQKTEVSITNELTDKILEIENIEEICAKENKIPGDSRAPTVADKNRDHIHHVNNRPTNKYRPISTKSLRSSLQNRHAKFGNGRSANLDPIYTLDVSRRLKNLGRRTGRLNSISIMREQLNNMSHERQRSNSVQLPSRPARESNSERRQMINEGRSRLNSLTNVDSINRRQERYNSLTSGQERDRVIENSRERLNSVNGEERTRLMDNGILMGLRGNNQQNNNNNNNDKTLAGRAQRIGSVSNIRQQLLHWKEGKNENKPVNNNNNNGNNNNNNNNKRSRRLNSISDIRNNYRETRRKHEQDRMLRQRLHSMGDLHDIKKSVRSAIENTMKSPTPKEKKNDRLAQAVAARYRRQEPEPQPSNDVFESPEHLQQQQQQQPQPPRHGLQERLNRLGASDIRNTVRNSIVNTMNSNNPTQNNEDEFQGEPVQPATNNSHYHHNHPHQKKHRHSNPTANSNLKPVAQPSSLSRPYNSSAQNEKLNERLRNLGGGNDIRNTVRNAITNTMKNTSEQAPVRRGIGLDRLKDVKNGFRDLKKASGYDSLGYGNVPKKLRAENVYGSEARMNLSTNANTAANARPANFNVEQGI